MVDSESAPIVPAATLVEMLNYEPNYALPLLNGEKIKKIGTACLFLQLTDNESRAALRG